MSERLKEIAAKQGWVFPNHTGENFYNLAPSVLRLLGIDAVNKGLSPAIEAQLGGPNEVVVAILFDAFGQSRIEEQKGKMPSLDLLLKRGKRFGLTSQFPSTTAAHVTSFATLAPVSGHKTVEWQFYHEGVGEVIRPLLFNNVIDEKRDTLLAKGRKVGETLAPFALPEMLKKNHVTSAVVQPAVVHSSAFSKAAAGEGLSFGFKSIDEAFSIVAKLIASRSGKLFVYLYIDAHDSAAHMYGPRSLEATAIIGQVSSRLNEFLDREAEDATVLLFADHGQVDVSGEAPLYINSLYPEITVHLRRSASDQLIRFGGSARDLFLYLKKQSVELVKEDLSVLLRNKAAVLYSRELIEAGLWGPEENVDSSLRARLGDLCILPYGAKQVYWYEPPYFECVFKGHHGGLTAEEMNIPLLVFNTR